MRSFDASKKSIDGLIDDALAILGTLTSYHIRITRSTATGNVIWYSDNDYVAPFSLYSKLLLPNMDHEREVLLYNGNLYNRVSDIWRLTFADRPQPLSQRLGVGRAVIPGSRINVRGMAFALVGEQMVGDVTTYEFAAEAIRTTLTTLSPAGRDTNALQLGDHLYRISLWIDPMTSYLHRIREYEILQEGHQGDQTTTVFSRHNDVSIHVPLPSDSSC